MRGLRILGLIGALAAGSSALAAQTMPPDSTGTMRRLGPNGPEAGRIPVKTKLSGNVTATARISADSAAALALSKTPEGGQVSSGELKISKGVLVYEIKVVPTGTKGVRKFYIDAMTGIVQLDKNYGGMKGQMKRSSQQEKVNKAAAGDTVR